ncbi:MAG: MerR family transcriptional regulator [Candidatus Velamenicoccus archaeovorus]
MEGFTVEELAARAGVPASTVRRLIDVGVLHPRGTGSPFGAVDVQTVRVALACEEAGLSIEGIGAAVAAGRLSFSFLDANWYRRFAFGSGRTLSDVASAAGLRPDVLARILEAFGYARPEPADPLRDDQLQLVELMVQGLGHGAVDEAGAVRFGRAVAASLMRIARAENEIYHDNIEVPLLRSGLSEAETMERASRASDGYTELLEHAIVAAYRRQQELATIEHLVEHIESVLEESGPSGPDELPTAIAFVDLEGYTRLTDERGDQEAARLADALGELVERRTRQHRGQTLKWIGDGVMSSFPEPSNAVAAAVEMVEDAPDQGLPPAHVGVAAGPVVRQAGDFFGRAVNTAARLSAYARGGQVLVDEVVAAAPPTPGIAVRELGRVELKGLRRPVRVFEAVRA